MSIAEPNAGIRPCSQLPSGSVVDSGGGNRQFSERSNRKLYAPGKPMKLIQ